MLGARRMMARSARAVTQRRNAGGIPEMLQSNVWRKSTGMYITYIVAGCVVIEAVYGGVTDAIWNTYNSGKLYHQVDWSKFIVETDDDDDDDEDDE